MEQTPEYGLEADIAGGTEFYQRLEGTYAEDNIEVIPRFATIYRLNEQHVFKLFYSQAINRPSFYQNSINSLNPWLEDLSPEKTRTIELNYITLPWKNISLNASIFRNEMEELIIYQYEIGEDGSWIESNSNSGKTAS